jgi:ATP synthase protein I
MSEPDPDPEKLRALGRKLDEAHEQRRVREVRPPPTQAGIAFRFTTEMVLATVVGAAMGWGIDRLFGTRPFGIIIVTLLGAAAGIRGVIRAAAEINAQQAKAAAPNDDEER